jgi:hypothetical protein
MLFSRGQKEPATGDRQDKSLRVWISPSLKTRRFACAVIAQQGLPHCRRIIGAGQNRLPGSGVRIEGDNLGTRHA